MYIYVYIFHALQFYTNVPHPANRKEKRKEIGNRFLESHSRNT